MLAYLNDYAIKYLDAKQSSEALTKRFKTMQTLQQIKDALEQVHQAHENRDYEKLEAAALGYQVAIDERLEAVQ